MANDVAIYDAEMLKLLSGMANKDDGGGSVTGPPTLKINYDPDSIHERGCWVVGQKKAQDGSISEEGQVAKGLVILLARNRWSYYNQKDTTKNCNSPFYLRGEMVRGSNYGYICGKQCPMRADGINPRCKCQIVLFGQAVTAEGKFIECISYLGGDSYMPTQSYLESIEKAKVKGGYVAIPLFARLTMLDTVRKQNEGTKYFQALFNAGPMFKERGQLVKFQEDRDEALQYIERSNAIPAEPVAEPAMGAAPAPATPATPATPVTSAAPAPMEPPASVEPAINVTPVNNDSVPDFAKTVTGDGGVPWETPEATEAPPAETATPAAQPATDDGFDLINTIESLINT